MLAQHNGDHTKINISALARKWSLPGKPPIPVPTLYNRVTGVVVGAGVASGGKGRGRVLDQGKFSFFSVFFSLLIPTPYLCTCTHSDKFFSDDEKELSDLATDLQVKGFPLSKKQLRSLAFQYADKNRIRGFSPESKKAGRKWVSNFMKRHPHLIEKQAKNLSVARAMCGNPTTVKKWFEEYQALLKRLDITSPEQIWSGDETGVQLMPKEGPVVAVKGTQAWQQVPGEQGETSTVLTFVSAAGKVCPPLVLHKGQRVQQYWLDGIPPGWTVGATESGYINKQKFTEYGIRWGRFLRSHNLVGKPHVLIIDSHSSHVYNVDFFEEMKEIGVEVMAIPPHTSHLLQALDSTPFATFKRKWYHHVAMWNLTHHGRAPRKGRDFWDILFNAWNESLKQVAIIQSGFRKTGIYPVNFEAIPKERFGPSAVTDSKLSRSNNVGFFSVIFLVPCCVLPVQR